MFEFLFVASDTTEPKKPESSQPTVQMTSETNQGRHQRHSLIGLFTGDHGRGSEHPHTNLPLKGNFFFILMVLVSCLTLQFPSLRLVQVTCLLLARSRI